MKKGLLHIIGITIVAVQLIASPLEAYSTDIEKDRLCLNIIPNVSVAQFEQKGDNLHIKFSMDLNVVDVKSKHRLVYTPILNTPDMNIELPMVSLQGRGNYKNSQRKMFLSGSQELSNDITVKGYGNGARIVNYEYSLPYQSWMADARLELKCQIICRCGDLLCTTMYIDLLAKMASLELVPVTGVLTEDANIVIVDSVANIIVAANPFVAHISSYEDDIIALRTSKDKGALRIYFELSKSSLNRNFMTNAEVLQSIETVTAEINKTNELKVAKILIAGFASVEGTFSFNEQLSINRAESISDYLQKNTNIDTTLIETYNGGEDWAGLRELVAESDMEYRSEVLLIMDIVPVRVYDGQQLVDGRNRQLMSLMNGEPYRYMYKHFFPQLRQAGYIRIYYEVNKDSVAQKINLAILEIEAKRYDKALALLQEVASDERSDVAFGVCYMMMGDFDRAKEYLQKAADRGDANAQKNLEQVMRAAQVEI